MISSKVLKYSIKLTKLRKTNSIPIGRQFSTVSQQLQQYSRIARIAGTGIISIIAYGLISDFDVYAHSKKKVSKFKKLKYIDILPIFILLSYLLCRYLSKYVMK